MKELAQTHRAARPTSGRPSGSGTPTRQLDRSKVRGSGEPRPHRPRLPRPRRPRTRTTSSSPTPTSSRERFHAWLLQQENAGRTFTAEQLAWLERIRDHVAASLAITTDDFGYTPFVERGGLGKAAQVFGDDLAPLLDELNEVLAA